MCLCRVTDYIKLIPTVLLFCRVVIQNYSLLLTIANDYSCLLRDSYEKERSNELGDLLDRLTYSKITGDLNAV